MLFLLLQSSLLCCQASRAHWPCQCVAPGWEASRRPPPLCSFFSRQKTAMRRTTAHYLGEFKKLKFLPPIISGHLFSLQITSTPLCNFPLEWPLEVFRTKRRTAARSAVVFHHLMRNPLRNFWQKNRIMSGHGVMTSFSRSLLAPWL